MVNTILSGAWDTHLFVVPIFGVAIGLSATTIGIILASFAAATFVIRLVLPLIQRRVRSWTLVRGHGHGGRGLPALPVVQRR